MATITLNLAGLVPANTAVSAYPAANWSFPARMAPSGDPEGPAAATASTDEDGVVTFDGLDDNTEFWVYADGQYVAFNTLLPPQVSNGEITDPSVLSSGEAAEGSSLGSVVRKIEVFDRDGASIGFVPVYDEIA